jgi:hypothetical protein
MKIYGGVAAPQFLTSALDGGEWSASRPWLFTPRWKAPDTNLLWGWLGPRLGLNAVEETKILHCAARRYTDWAITTLYLTILDEI